VRHSHSGGGSVSGQADDVFGTDVGGEERGADDEPACVAPGEEVVGCRGYLGGRPFDDPDDTEEVYSYYYPVE